MVHRLHPVGRWALDVGRWTFFLFPPRIRARSEENGMNDVRVARAFWARERFGLQANSDNARDSRLFAEFRSARIRAQHVTNSETESRHQDALGASTA